MYGENINKKNIPELWQLSGKWHSTYGSPGLHIYSVGTESFIEVQYKLGYAFIVPLHKTGNLVFFYLCGLFTLEYDIESDRLILSEEGVYVRFQEN